LFYVNNELFKLMKTLIRLLTKKKLKLSVAESCTGGLLASSITSLSGASKIFNLGLVTYSNQAKINILKINKNIIRKYGAVSHECCFSMVKNLSKISEADINVSITGIAGPKGGTKQKPIGLVYIGIKKGNKIQINKCLFKNKNRSFIQKAAVKKTLDLILSATK
tara:strand:- start:52 stop:546 length:495 start_codon:yes stop_codon:yes gene_type:complete